MEKDQKNTQFLKRNSIAHLFNHRLILRQYIQIIHIILETRLLIINRLHILRIQLPLPQQLRSRKHRPDIPPVQILLRLEPFRQRFQFVQFAGRDAADFLLGLLEETVVDGSLVVDAQGLKFDGVADSRHYGVVDGFYAVGGHDEDSGEVF